MTSTPIDAANDTARGDETGEVDAPDFDASRTAYLTTAISELEAEIAHQHTGSGHDDDLYEALNTIAEALGLK